MISGRIKKAFALMCLAGFLLTLMTGCVAQGGGQYDKNIFALDTIISMKAFGPRTAKKALDKAAKRIKEIEDHMSPNKEGSDVSKINQAAGVEPVKVHDDTFYVIKKALEYGELTEGVFDITIRPIVELWGIGTDHARVPEDEEIEERLSLVDYKKVIIDEDKKTVFLEDKGMGIDLGAIAKGYAADETARILVEGGVEKALLNLGGNVITIGSKPDGEPWRIGLQDPRTKETGRPHFAIVEVANATVVSSGDYERYIVDVYEETGVRYHHIFDPKTGFPAQSGLMACSIITGSSIDADALSTILFIMGYEGGFKFIEGLEGIEGIAVTLESEVYTTEGLEDRLIPSNEHYRIMD